MFVGRTSVHSLRANQLRLWFASVAYVLLNLLRHFGLKCTELERAQAGTIRLMLLKAVRYRPHERPPRRPLAERRRPGARGLRAHRYVAASFLRPYPA